MEDNKEYEINIQQKYRRRICFSPRETWKFSPLHNGTSTLEENTDINIFKINFRTINTHSTYNTQTYKTKLNNSEKLERIGNTEETYPIAISNQTSLVPGKPENSILTPTEGREKSRDQKKQRELENYHFRHNVIKSK